MSAASAETAPPSRHVCPVTGCEKTFLRKEHLKRHTRTHTDVPSYTCHICQRGFTRNDVLQRHITRHEQQSKTLGRSGRACDRCHGSKVRCDGNMPCSTCVKKGITCKDERDQVAKQAAPESEDEESSSEEELTHVTERMESVRTEPATHEEFFKMMTGGEEPPPATAEPSEPPRDFDQMADPFPSVVSPPTSIASWDANNVGTNSSIQFAEKWAPLFLQPHASSHIQTYFSEFHSRWPIIHSSSFNETTDPFMLTGSMTMIGAWIEGSEEAVATALVLHDRLKTHLCPKMTQLVAKLDAGKPWPMVIFQAFLLNIIFGVYRGTQVSVLEASIMLHTLVGVLRALGFFDAEVIAGQEKQGQFFPYLFVKSEERIRLAAAIVKINSYLSILRNEPPIIQPEELHYTLPSSFAQWNSPGLPVFKKRFESDPFKNRTQKTIFQLLGDPTAAVLVEDSQLGICGTQDAIWRINTYRSLQIGDNATSVAHKRESIRQTCERWKFVLDDIGNRIVDMGDPHPLKEQTIWCYYGSEDHTELGWITQVLRRPQRTYFDTLILYHLQGMHLYSDIARLKSCAQEQKRNGVGSVVAAHTIEPELRTWAHGPDARRAVWHASCILSCRQASHFDFAPWNVDPIAHAAIATSILVFWGYVYFSGGICEDCAVLAHVIATMTVMPIELLEWNPNSMETWISDGGSATICGIEICACNSEELFAAFRKYLPVGSRAWKYAEHIAPFL